MLESPIQHEATSACELIKLDEVKGFKLSMPETCPEHSHFLQKTWVPRKGLDVHGHWLREANRP